MSQLSRGVVSYLLIFTRLYIICIIAIACGQKSDQETLLITKEATPDAPVIVSPTPLPSYTNYSSSLRIVGCFDTNCGKNVSKFSVQATGAGTLITNDANFTFDATMLVGETRVFSFTLTNYKGVVSPAKTLTVTFDSTFLLTPNAALFNGATSTDGPRTALSGSHILNFVTSLPYLTNVPISNGGFVLTAGALNPK